MIVETVTVVTYATCTFNMTIVNVQSTAYVKKEIKNHLNNQF